MEDQIRRVYEMFLRVLAFMKAYAADFQDTPFVEPTVASLQTETDILTELGAAKISRSAAAKDSTITRADARQDLRDDLEYVADVWRSMPDETAGMENKFRIPRGNNDQNLVATGRSFADEAEIPEVAALLDSRNLKKPFFTALREKADIFEQTIDTAEAKRGERVGTNASFAQPARNGKKLVNKLSPTVKHTYRNNPQKLAEWLVASHIERAPKRKPQNVADKKDNSGGGSGEGSGGM